MQCLSSFTAQIRQIPLTSHQADHVISRRAARARWWRRFWWRSGWWGSTRYIDQSFERQYIRSNLKYSMSTDLARSRRFPTIVWPTSLRLRFAHLIWDDGQILISSQKWAPLSMLVKERWSANQSTLKYPTSTRPYTSKIRYMILHDPTLNTLWTLTPFQTAIGKVDEILGPINQVYFTIKPQEGIVATSFKSGDKFYIGGDKLLPLDRSGNRVGLPGIWR